MNRLRLNLPSITTRTDSGPVQLPGLNLVIGATETKVPSYGVRRVEPPTWERYMLTPPLNELTKGYRTSRSQPISHLNVLISPTRSPIAGQIPQGCTSDSYDSLERALDNGAAQGLSDLDGHVPDQILTYTSCACEPCWGPRHVPGTDLVRSSASESPITSAPSAGASSISFGNRTLGG